ncbi:MAG: serine hydrolase domain-containing protein [Saprospiraceae bacterium]
MKKHFSISFLMLLLATPILGQADFLSFKAALQDTLNRIIEEQAIPGATAAIVLPDGQLISLAAGYSDKEEQLAMPLGAQMLLGSVGKIFVSAVVLQLVDEGKIKLSDQVRSYFKGVDWYDRLPNAADLSIASLLNHTSGLPRYVFDPAFLAAVKADPMRSWSPADCLAMILDKKASHPVGKGWGYSDTNYILLGLIIEKVTGESYYQQLEKRIISVFHLRNTYPSTQRDLPGLTQAYIGENNFFNLPKKVVSNGLYAMNPQFEWTGGGLVTNVEDLAYFLKWLHTGKLMSSVLYKQFVQAVDFQTGLAAETGYGLGTFVWKASNDLFYGHAGVMPGYFTQAEYAKKGGFAIAFQMNTDQGTVRVNHENVQRLAKLVQEFLAR